MTNAIFQTPVCQLIELHNLFIELTAKTAINVANIAI